MFKLKMALTGLFVMVAAVAAQAQTIDFETFPDGSPVTEGMLLTNQYADWGVTFELIAGGDGPRIAGVGGAQTAFQGVNSNRPECGVNSNTRADMPAPGVDVGCLFLTDDNIHDQSAFALRVNYLTPVYQASGELLDIDATELWEIRALDAGNNLLAVINLDENSPGAGDGLATAWSFNLTDPIHTIELHPSFVNPHQYGLAFDNFSPSSIPLFPNCYAGVPIASNDGVTYQFDGSGSTDDDGTVTAWHWDFGDGNTSDDMSPSHTYAAAGSYHVLLTVTDNHGNQSSCSPDQVVATENQNWDALKAMYK